VSCYTAFLAMGVFDCEQHPSYVNFLTRISTAELNMHAVSATVCSSLHLQIKRLEGYRLCGVCVKVQKNPSNPLPASRSLASKQIKTQPPSPSYAQKHSRACETLMKRIFLGILIAAESAPTSSSKGSQWQNLQIPATGVDHPVISRLQRDETHNTTHPQSRRGLPSLERFLPRQMS
jgi:hypothetical protein